jgi:hypothetical protein
VEVNELNTVPLIAADTPSWVVELSTDHAKEGPPVPLVVQVRFVAFNASPNVAPTAALCTTTQTTATTTDSLPTLLDRPLLIMSSPLA